MRTAQVRIGGRDAGRIGFGNQMLAASETLSIEAAIRVIHAALDAGVRLLDTADVYAPNGCWTGQGERLLGEALRRWSGPRDEVLVATKGGHLLGVHSEEIARDGRPERLRRACEASLKALGVEAIDLYQLHSVDPQTPLADSVGALADLRREGKIRMIGLSNLGRRQIAEAAAEAEIVSVQNRFSIVSTETRAVADWCGQAGIAILAYSPLGRTRAGALGDLVGPLAAIARRESCSPQRVALAWLMSLGDHILPIPGSTSLAHLADNMAAADLTLTEADRAALEAPAGG